MAYSLILMEMKGQDLMSLEYFSYVIATNYSSKQQLNYSEFPENESSCDVSTVLSNSEYEISTLETVGAIIVLSIIILGTIFGNILVILGVFTYKPLRIVQNFFIVSLAAADLAVAVLVMPFNVAYSILGKWLWGKHLCKMWLTCDITSCTSSILNLCAIALDRYYAITDPIKYANKRTLNRVMIQIAGVWIVSLLISSPPLLGWNDWPNEFTPETPCQLTSERGYVVYSSLGSFFIPLIIMAVVYIKIFIAAKKRLRKRTMGAHICKKLIVEDQSQGKEDSESDSGESIKRCQRKAFLDMKKNFFVPLLILTDPSTRDRIGCDVGHAQNDAPSSGSACYNNQNTKGSIKRSKRSKQEKPLLACVTKHGDVIHQFIEQKQRISLSKERRAARTLGVIMGVFVICWLPFFIMYVILSFCSQCCPSSRFINFVTWLGYINSTLNPIIYTIFNLDFRKSFKKILGLS